MPHAACATQPSLFPGLLDAAAQRALIEAVMAGLEAAPLYRPAMPRTGQPFSVRMSNFGPLGWVSDREGYRYQSTHPVTGRAWPAMPEAALDLWRRLSGWPDDPEACLVNHYDGAARMGLHVDSDEAEMAAPVLSISLGDTAIFRMGGPRRSDPTRSFRLASGDVLLLDGAARLARHGIDRILPGSSRIVPGGGRVNLTLRRVTRRAESGPVRGAGPELDASVRV